MNRSLRLEHLEDRLTPATRIAAPIIVHPTVNQSTGPQHVVVSGVSHGWMAPAVLGIPIGSSGPTGPGGDSGGPGSSTGDPVGPGPGNS